MPKEYVYGRFDDYNPNTVKVGWSRETGTIQIATVNPEGETVCSGSSDDPRDLKTISKELRDLGVLNIGRDEKARALYIEWERAIDFVPESRKVEGGYYVDLDRRGANLLIKLIRKARDQSLGKDE